MTGGFHDHFSTVAAEYARFRPRYPEPLMRFLAELAPARRLAWDAGTGNGQAAVALAERFDHVIATDASSGQIANAQAHPRIEYRVAPAERSGLPDASVDLATAAQAAHWFDLPAYTREADRVLVPGGVVALFGYGDPGIHDSPVLDRALQRFDFETLADYWPPERKLISASYAPIALPYPDLPTPMFEMQHRMTLPQLVGHLRTWSGVRAYIQRHDEDPVAAFEREIAADWGDPNDAHLIAWPIFVRAGRKPGGAR